MWILRFAGAIWLLTMAHAFGFAIVPHLPPFLSFIVIASVGIVDFTLFVRFMSET